MGEARGRVPAITGQAILSRFPIDEAAALPFKAQDRWRWSINPVQPRRGGRIALKAKTGGVMIYNAHIESGGNDPLQHKQIDEMIADQSNLVGEVPVLMGGDFNNTLRPRSLTLRSLTGASFIDALGDDGSKRGPTSLGQTHPIDWIFIKHITPANGRVVDSKTASDHSPVMVALGMAATVAASR